MKLTNEIYKFLLLISFYTILSISFAKAISLHHPVDNSNTKFTNTVSQNGPFFTNLRAFFVKYVSIKDIILLIILSFMIYQLNNISDKANKQTTNVAPTTNISAQITELSQQIRDLKQPVDVSGQITELSQQIEEMKSNTDVATDVRNIVAIVTTLKNWTAAIDKWTRQVDRVDSKVARVIADCHRLLKSVNLPPISEERADQPKRAEVGSSNASSDGK